MQKRAFIGRLTVFFIGGAFISGCFCSWPKTTDKNGTVIAGAESKTCGYSGLVVAGLLVFRCIGVLICGFFLLQAKHFDDAFTPSW